MKTPSLFSIYQKVEEQQNMNQEIKVKANTIRTIELFAGVGGFRLGLENTQHKSKNFEVVWSNQWEPSTKMQHASTVYTARFGSDNHSNDDISTVSTSDIPNHDFLVGGFPCQDYSVASTLKNSQGIIGKKGVLWWEIHRILKDKKENAPKYLLLENVDRLLKSPASQRGRDFAIILSSLNSLGYAVEWRVINASDYGMPQKRKRIFIFATRIGKTYNTLTKETPLSILNEKGVFAKTFPTEIIEEKDLLISTLSNDLVDITNNFNKKTPKMNAFLDAGYMVNGTYYTSKCKADYNGESILLGDILEEEKDVPEEFYINESDLERWKYQKGAKSIDRINKTTGHKYKYTEGEMSFPDCLEKPARTIITGEGGASASRCKHVVKVNGRYRRLTPIELEKANMFPANHTEGVTASKRAFLMGNALVVGIIEKLGNTILEEI